jgi:probable HAF family extracellular repeat protein
VVGLSNTATGLAHAFITGPNGVGMTDLGTLGGGYSEAHGINGAGQVVGESDTAAGARHAFITGPNGVDITDLGTLAGGSSLASGINDAGQVVGWSITAAGAYQAFITGPNGVGMTDLNSLVSQPGGVVLSEATGINNHGQVAANIPEPETYAMLLAGLVLVGFIARRRRTA